MASRGLQRPKLRLLGSRVPAVDVIVTSCGEDPDVVLDTVKAACVMDYPRKRFRVVVSDDGADNELKARVYALRKSYSNLFYHARNKAGLGHHGFKAGNINKAVRFVADLPGGPSPWIFVLDADMIPEPDILRALVVHAVNSDDVAMVALPQVWHPRS
jgi:cellulose synthase/poly-beta-1,6-N-acetylglucosamine synthase-like glycosyltransferase